MNLLLVEPEYYTRYPPIGLLKLASFHRSKNNSVELIRGCKTPQHKPDKIYVTSLYTWAWKSVWRAIRYYKRLYPDVELILGGIYASLMPRHAESSGADFVFTEIFKEAEGIMPAYDLIPQWDASIIQTSRGCNRTCQYCAVWRIEGKIGSEKNTLKDLVYPTHKRIILWDNNILQSNYWGKIFEELIWFSKTKKMKIDFNQGIDARLITSDITQKIAQMKTTCVRLSYDTKELRNDVENAILAFSQAGLRKRHICVYLLFNFLDDPNDLFERVKEVLSWGAVAVPLRYQPLDVLKYNQHIGPKWDKERLNSFSKFRRVCGFGGVFPPYKWLVDRFNASESFDTAFASPPRNNTLENNAHKDFFNSWRRSKDWRSVSEKFLAKTW